MSNKDTKINNQQHHEKMMEELLLDLPIGTEWVYIPDDEDESKDDK